MRPSCWDEPASAPSPKAYLPPFDLLRLACTLLHASFRGTLQVMPVTSFIDTRTVAAFSGCVGGVESSHFTRSKVWKKQPESRAYLQAEVMQSLSQFGPDTVVALSECISSRGKLSMSAAHRSEWEQGNTGRAKEHLCRCGTVSKTTSWNGNMRLSLSSIMIRPMGSAMVRISGT